MRMETMLDALHWMKLKHVMTLSQGSESLSKRSARQANSVYSGIVRRYEALQAKIDWLQYTLDTTRQLRLKYQDFDNAQSYLQGVNTQKRRMDELEAENAQMRAELDIAQRFTEVHLATRHGAFVSEEDFPCPRCGGQVGHRINCPRGIAFSNPHGENR